MSMTGPSRRRVLQMATVGGWLSIAGCSSPEGNRTEDGGGGTMGGTDPPTVSPDTTLTPAPVPGSTTTGPSSTATEPSITPLGTTTPSPTRALQANPNGGTDPTDGTTTNDGTTPTDTCTPPPSTQPPPGKITAPNGDCGDEFGRSVALDGNGSTALVGAPRDETKNGVTGSVYVFDLSGDDGQIQTNIQPSDIEAHATFGRSVSLSRDGSTALMGAPRANESNSGAAYIYETVDGEWTRATKLIASDGDRDDHFGKAVTLSADGTMALIGAPQDDEPNGTDSGSAYVFEKAESTWNEVAKVAPEDGRDYDIFGISMAMAADGTRALIASRVFGPGRSPENGAAYVFVTSNGEWTQEQKLTVDGDFVGLDADATRALIGDRLRDSPGTVHVFERSGEDWQQTSKFSGEGERFPSSLEVSAKGNTALLTAALDDDPNGEDAGSGFLFQQEDGDWKQQTKLSAADGDSEDHFGRDGALSADGSTILIGAPRDEHPHGTLGGSAYVYTV